DEFSAGAEHSEQDFVEANCNRIGHVVIKARRVNQVEAGKGDLVGKNSTDRAMKRLDSEPGVLATDDVQGFGVLVECNEFANCAAAQSLGTQGFAEVATRNRKNAWLLDYRSHFIDDFGNRVFPCTHAAGALRSELPLKKPQGDLGSVRRSVG